MKNRNNTKSFDNNSRPAKPSFYDYPGDMGSDRDYEKNKRKDRWNNKKSRKRDQDDYDNRDW
jgi:hypothetical protein